MGGKPRWVWTALLVFACTTDEAAPESQSSGTESPVASTSDTLPLTSSSTTGETGDVTGSDGDTTSTSEDDSSSTEAEPPIVPGLRAEYFAGYHDRVLQQIEPQLDVNWGAAAPGGPKELGEDRFSVRWSGWLTAPTSGTYTLITETDDGVRVWLDEQRVIDDWTPHFVTRNEATVELTAGVPVALRVEYFEIDLDASARLAWSTRTLPEEVVPASAFTTVDIEDDVMSPKPPYQNPVVPFDCPDPGVFRSTDDAEFPGYYMVCTGGSFPLRYSRDMVHWQGTFSAVLPDGKPSWADNGARNWAPELHQVDDQVVAYFTTTDAQNRLCIGAAVADDPLGPYQESAGPLVQHPQGVIDATYFETADGRRWLLYKIDGNSVGQPTPIRARELATDGLSFAGGSTEFDLLVNDSSTWEGGVIEAMWITEHDGALYMFYSGNVYDNRYRTGVARSLSGQMSGPWEKFGPPILTNDERWVGPGHGTVMSIEDIDYFFYHAWTNAGDGTHLQSAGRHGLLDRITWVDGWPEISDGTPSTEWLPWPGLLE